MPIFNLAQWFAISDVRRTAHAAGRSGRTARDATHHLEARLERLALGTIAVWELLRETTELTDDDLRQRITEIDLRDGALDGRSRPTRRSCVACGRENSARRTRCLYCGHDLPDDGPITG